MRRSAPSFRRGEIYKLFQFYFDYFLSAEHDASKDSHFRAWYIDDHRVTSWLENFRDAEVGSLQFFTGLKGIGKTTHIRYVFSLDVEPQIQDDNLIVPFYIDNFIDKGRERLIPIATNTIYSAARILQEKFGLGFSPIDFVEFVEKHRRALFGGMLVEEFDRLKADDPNKLITYIREKYFHGYAAVYLKYFLNKSPIRKCIIVLDDLESAQSDFVADLVMLLLAIRNCLLNTGGVQRTFEVSILASCRPSTYEILKTHVTVNGYAIGDQFRLDRPVGVAKIVDRRFDVAIDRFGEGVIGDEKRSAIVKDIEKWRTSIAILKKILGKLSDRHSDLLVGLCNYDLRETFLAIKAILKYSFWYCDLAEDTLPGAFQLSDMDITLSEINVLRAVALRDYRFFRTNVDTPISNLFYNYPEAEVDLIVPMIAKYIYQRANRDYLIFKFDDLKNALNLCFSNLYIDAYLIEAINYLIQSQAIFQDKRISDGKEEIVYISRPRLFYVWRSLSRSAAFVEFFRDECNSELGREVNSKMPSSLLRGDDIFFEIGSFIANVLKRETEMVNRIISKGPKYRIEYEKIFGKQTISERLLEGYAASISAYYGAFNASDAEMAGINKLKSELNTRARVITRRMRPEA